MTDNEIVKALECCSNDEPHFCSVCPYYLQDKENDYCREDMNKDAFSLINRQKAEIERLKSDVSVSRDAYMSMKDRYEYEKEKVEKAKQKCIGIAKSLKTAKAEAYKEFAERLKKKYKPYVILGSEVAEVEIDNLLKEMLGENNETKTF